MFARKLQRDRICHKKDGTVKNLKKRLRSFRYSALYATSDLNEISLMNFMFPIA